MEFLAEKRGHSLEKRFLYTGKEQRREAKENYEEKCERSVISKMQNKPRWCPELTSLEFLFPSKINIKLKFLNNLLNLRWPDWLEATKKDGLKTKSNIIL